MAENTPAIIDSAVFDGVVPVVPVDSFLSRERISSLEEVAEQDHDIPGPLVGLPAAVTIRKVEGGYQVVQAETAGMSSLALVADSIGSSHILSNSPNGHMLIARPHLAIREGVAEVRKLIAKLGMQNCVFLSTQPINGDLSAIQIEYNSTAIALANQGQVLRDIITTLVHLVDYIDREISADGSMADIVDEGRNLMRICIGKVDYSPVIQRPNKVYPSLAVLAREARVEWDHRNVLESMDSYKDDLSNRRTVAFGRSLYNRDSYVPHPDFDPSGILERVNVEQKKHQYGLTIVIKIPPELGIEARNQLADIFYESKQIGSSRRFINWGNEGIGFGVMIPDIQHIQNIELYAISLYRKLHQISPDIVFGFTVGEAYEVGQHNQDGDRESVVAITTQGSHLAKMIKAASTGQKIYQIFQYGDKVHVNPDFIASTRQVTIGGGELTALEIVKSKAELERVRARRTAVNHLRMMLASASSSGYAQVIEHLNHLSLWGDAVHDFNEGGITHSRQYTDVVELLGFGGEEALLNENEVTLIYILSKVRGGITPEIRGRVAMQTGEVDSRLGQLNIGRFLRGLKDIGLARTDEDGRYFLHPVMVEVVGALATEKMNTSAIRAIANDMVRDYIGNSGDLNINWVITQANNPLISTVSRMLMGHPEYFGSDSATSLETQTLLTKEMVIAMALGGILDAYRNKSADVIHLVEQFNSIWGEEMIEYYKQVKVAKANDPVMILQGSLTRFYSALRLYAADNSENSSADAQFLLSMVAIQGKDIQLSELEIDVLAMIAYDRGIFEHVLTYLPEHQQSRFVTAYTTRRISKSKPSEFDAVLVEAMTYMPQEDMYEIIAKLPKELQAKVRGQLQSAPQQGIVLSELSDRASILYTLANIANRDLLTNGTPDEMGMQDKLEELGEIGKIRRRAAIEFLDHAMGYELDTATGSDLIKIQMNRFAVRAKGMFGGNQRIDYDKRGEFALLVKDMHDALVQTPKSEDKYNLVSALNNLVFAIAVHPVPPDMEDTWPDEAISEYRHRIEILSEAVEILESFYASLYERDDFSLSEFDADDATNRMKAMDYWRHLTQGRNRLNDDFIDQFIDTIITITEEVIKEVAEG